MSSTQLNQLCVPERVLKRIFDLINQVRCEYNVNSLQFSKELSFIAGEHACNMSTKKVPYGHEGIESRISQIPLSLSYTENIAREPTNEDPGKSIVVFWLKKSTSFARILSDFTHTGIGVAESEEGLWYCTQIFGTFKKKATKRDNLIIASRYVNRYRKKHDLPQLSIAVSQSYRLYRTYKNTPEFINSINQSTIRGLFSNCVECDFVVENISPKNDIIPSFFHSIRERPTASRVLKKDFNEMGFLMVQVGDSQYTCALFFAKCPLPYCPISPKYKDFSVACHCLQLVNDYRKSKKLEPFSLSLQWCIAAERHSQKIVQRQKEIEVFSLTKKLINMTPGSDVHCGICIIGDSNDSLREVFLLWLSNRKIKQLLLSEYQHFGFGFSKMGKHSLISTRIVGMKADKNDIDPLSIIITPDTEYPVFPELSSDELDSEEELPVDTSATFHLTG